MNIRDVLKQRQKTINREIAKNLKSGKPELHYKMMHDYFRRGGKRLRSSLCVISCEANGGKAQKALNTAAAFEILQDWILIHDDFEDDSDERRGKPTLHKLYGAPLAINAGDGLHAVMWKTLMKNRKLLGDEKAFRVMQEFIDLLLRTTEGQTMELDWVRRGAWNVKEKDYFEMISKKTSWYTITYPLRMGAIIAGVKNVNKFNAFGENLGKAFQIQDDLLNIVGDKKKYGKEIGGDVYEGKRTLILIHCLSKCKAKERKELLRIMRKSRHRKTPREVAWVIALMHAKGSVKYSQNKALFLAKKSKKQFKALRLKNTKAKKELEALIDFVVEREL